MKKLALLLILSVFVIGCGTTSDEKTSNTDPESLLDSYYWDLTSLSVNGTNTDFFYGYIDFDTLTDFEGYITGIPDYGTCDFSGTWTNPDPGYIDLYVESSTNHSIMPEEILHATYTLYGDKLTLWYSFWDGDEDMFINVKANFSRYFN